MALPISYDYGYLAPDVDFDEVVSFQDNVDLAHKKLTQGGGLGADFLGWVDPSKIVSPEELQSVKQLAAQIQDSSDVLVSIGIGGSYLGARAVIEAVATPGQGPEVVFAGKSLSVHEHYGLLQRLHGKRFSIDAISKSGTTTEPAIAFRLFRDALEQSVGKEEAKTRIVATTDASKGALRKLATDEGYATLPIADDVGGRWSVLSPVGLLPIAVAGVDIDALLAGARDIAVACETSDVTKNPAYFYAAARNFLYLKGYTIGMLSIFEPRLHYVAEWWKQLFGESEGKSHISFFPASVELTTDLHSMGQWIQQGRRSIIETFLIVDGGEPNLPIPKADNNLDGLDYLVNQSMADVNKTAFRATALAHRDGGVPNSTVHMATRDAYTMGAMLYFFERACGVSGYLMGINPFDQPGVEAYKVNMFALLGKPGYEKETEDVNARLAALPKDTTVQF